MTGGRPSRRPRRRLLASVVLLPLAVLAAGCGASATTSASGSPASSLAASTETPTATHMPTATPPPTVTPAPTASSDASAIQLDPALLAILPAEVAGSAIRSEPQAFAEAVRNPDFAANVTRAVFPIAVGHEDLASGVVAELRPGVWSEGFFRDWRDSYDRGACEPAGGTAGRAEAELGGRVVHITSCAQGLLVYHVHLGEPDVVVSLVSLGPARYGEQIMVGLRPSP